MEEVAAVKVDDGRGRRSARGRRLMRAGAACSLAASVTLLAFAGAAQAAAFTVNSTADSSDASAGDTVCATATAVCTLRAAIEEANALAGADTITFALPNPSTINLTGAPPPILEQLTITGPGASALTVRRSSGGNYAVFSATTTTSISAMTITNGVGEGTPGTVAGGVASSGNLTLDGVVVTNNSASATATDGATAIGGGVGVIGGSLTITRSTITNNTVTTTITAGTATNAVGGGIGVLNAGAISVSDSTIAHNTATATGTGSSNTLALGGGIGILQAVSTSLTNITVSDNHAFATGGLPLPVGGGVGVFATPTTITSATIAFNEGGIGANFGSLASNVYLRNTILSNPVGGANCGSYIGIPITSGGFNLSSDASCVLAATGDQEGVDPLLGPLASNGGPTFTHAPAIGGPAIDQGSGAAAAPHPAVTTDQRGRTRPVDLPGAVNDPAGDGSDIGALERQRSEGLVLADNPAGFWRFGEPPGSTTLLDSSPNANHGTYIGGVTLGQIGALASDPDTAALYDGINDQGRVPDANSLDVGNTFSAEGWIKRTSTAQTHELMNKGASGIQLVVMSGASLNKVVLRRAGVGTIAQSTTGILADGNYHHVVATMNGLGSTARIYIDGADVTQVLAPGQTILNTAFPITFGSFGSAPSQPAYYDEFALYDNALSAGQVAAHYAARL
jgi:CSLREA domain-containing protein